MLYWPNPAHKRETSEAGPPKWRPHKSACPRMRVEEREELLRLSVADSSHSASPRYALRVTDSGFEWFVARAHRVQDDEVEYHGYPVNYVPPRVLRVFRDRGSISDADYRRLTRQLG